MNIPFLDLAAAYRELKDEIDDAVSRVMGSGWYIQGEEVEKFEANFARYCEASHAIGVGNGLDALVLTLRALGIGIGDEVLVPSNTFIATWLAVSEVGATPIPIEPIAETHNIDPAKLEEAINPRTRAIIAVHLYGQPTDLNAITAITQKNGLFLIEDAAQAQGARYCGRRIGAHGDAVCWSFYPGKNLGAMGDGGAVTTNDSKIADKIRMLSNYGSRKKYYNEFRGRNSRLDPIQAAILGVKLPCLDKWNERRCGTAQKYMTELVSTNLILPAVPNWADPVWHQFVVRSRRRDEVMSDLAKLGIPTQIHYPLSPAQQAAYQDLAIKRPLPLSEQLAAEVFSLPIGPHQTADVTGAIISAVREVCQDKRCRSKSA